MPTLVVLFRMLGTKEYRWRCSRLRAAMGEASERIVLTRVALQTEAGWVGEKHSRKSQGKHSSNETGHTVQYADSTLNAVTFRSTIVFPILWLGNP